MRVPTLWDYIHYKRVYTYFYSVNMQHKCAPGYYKCIHFDHSPGILKPIIWFSKSVSSPFLFDRGDFFFTSESNQNCFLTFSEQPKLNRKLKYQRTLIQPLIYLNMNSVILLLGLLVNFHLQVHAQLQASRYQYAYASQYTVKNYTHI